MRDTTGWARVSIIATLLLVAVALAGCASTPAQVAPGYAAYLQFVGQQQQRDDARLASIAAAAQSCTDSRCVEHVAALAAMASASGGTRDTQIAPPPRETSGWETFAHVASTLSPIAGTLVNGAVSWHQSDASRDISIAQSTALDHMISGAVAGIATTAQTATPSITVGGDYVSGTQTTTTIGGDVIGRDRVDNSGVLGDHNRWQSPDDNHAGDCREAGNCSQPTPQGP